MPPTDETPPHATPDRATHFAALLDEYAWAVRDTTHSLDLALYDYGACADDEREQRAALDAFVFALLADADELAFLRKGGVPLTFGDVSYPPMLGGCTCYGKAPTILIYRDRRRHLDDCPAKGSGHPVGAYLAATRLPEGTNDA